MSTTFAQQLLRTILLPLAWCYDGVTRLRNWAFDHGHLSTQRFATPIIGVGNLAVGGTGKTPHTQWIVEQLLQMDKRVAVLSRGYGRKTRGFPAPQLTLGMSPFNCFATSPNAISLGQFAKSVPLAYKPCCNSTIHQRLLCSMMLSNIATYRLV